MSLLCSRCVPAPLPVARKGISALKVTSHSVPAVFPPRCQWPGRGFPPSKLPVTVLPLCSRPFASGQGGGFRPQSYQSQCSRPFASGQEGGFRPQSYQSQCSRCVPAPLPVAREGVSALKVTSHSVPAVFPPLCQWPGRGFPLSKLPVTVFPLCSRPFASGQGGGFRPQSY